MQLLSCARSARPLNRCALPRRRGCCPSLSWHERSEARTLQSCGRLGPWRTAGVRVVRRSGPEADSSCPEGLELEPETES